jgi:F420-non-reducing hydrogenase iron-sulfur subunit
VPLLQRLLGQYGIEPARLRLEWISAAEGDRFARVVQEFTAELRRLGPLAWRQMLAAEA